MTDEEKTEEYLKCEFACGDYDRENKKCIFKNKCEKYKIYLDGLAEGRKDRNCVNCSNHGKQFEVMKLEKENAKLSKMLDMAINEVLLCGKQMKVEHPSMIVWTEETFRAELEKRVEKEE